MYFNLDTANEYMWTLSLAIVSISFSKTIALVQQ